MEINLNSSLSLSFSVSVILKERKGTDSVTLAWQGPEPADGAVVEYEVTYYEKVRRFGVRWSSWPFGPMWVLRALIWHMAAHFYRTLGRDCNVNTDMLHSVPINIHGSPVCQKPLRLSHFRLDDIIVLNKLQRFCFDGQQKSNFYFIQLKPLWFFRLNRQKNTWNVIYYLQIHMRLCLKSDSNLVHVWFEIRLK